MKDILDKLPRWALILVIIILLGPAGYALTLHVSTDMKQSTDISDLATTVSNLAVVVEYNYKETERNSNTVASNTATITETQMRLERILGRIEARLDEEND